METISFILLFIGFIIAFGFFSALIGEMGRKKRYKKRLADFNRWEKSLNEQRDAEGENAGTFNHKISIERKNVFTAQEQNPVI